MNNKLFISVFLSFLLLTPVSLTQPQWYEQNSGVNRELTDVCFVDQNNGWISGWTETMLHSTDGGHTWNPQNILPNNAYFSVFFTDTLNGWASGYAGKIVHTSDGGQTWVDQFAPVNTDYYRIYFFNSEIGWIAGGDPGVFPNNIDHRVILHTTNGGNSWSAQYSEAYESLLRSIFFVDQDNGYATGESGVIMKTTDGGSNWSLQVISSFHFYDIFFIDNLTGWVTGKYLGLPHHTSIFKTTDGGTNWNETALGKDENLSSIYFTDTRKGWAVGGNDVPEGIVYYTSDGGANWALQNIPSVNFLYRVFFFDENFGWAPGHLGTIIITDYVNPVELSSFTVKVLQGSGVQLDWRTETEINNYGFDIERAIDDDNDWSSIAFIKGYGNSNSPKFYKYFDYDIGKKGDYYYRLKQIDIDGTYDYSNVVSVEVGGLNKYYLSQNYPNPFNPATRINFSLPGKQMVMLKVYNTLGELVRELVNEIKEPGSYSVAFNASEYPNGMYFYQLKAGDFIETKKMVLTK